MLLALRALGLGDLLTAVPALRALRRACPGHRLVLATPAALEPLVRLAGVADEVLDTSGLEGIDWWGPAPDLAVDLHGRGPESHRLLQRLAPARLVAFGCEEAGHAGPAWRPEEHEVRRWCRLVREVLDVPVDPTDLRLAVPPPPEGAGAVLVHPGAAYPARRWPVDRFAAVARAVVAAGHRVEVTGGPGEEALAQAVADAAGSPGASALGGRTSLGDLAARVAHARLVVCGDTGVAHLATAFGTPSVLLFGPTSPARWGPPPGGPHTVIFHGDGQGDPWGGEVAPALLRVTVPEVVAEVQHHLGRPLTGAARRTTPGSA